MRAPASQRMWEWRPVGLGLLTRALGAGWKWGRDPRRDGLSLVSPRGTVFEFRLVNGRSLTRRYWAPGLT